MPDVTLQHCVETLVHGPELPMDLTLDLMVGGGSGDGVVEVHAEPSPLPAPLVVSTGSMGRHFLAGASIVRLHYKQSALGPAEVTVTYRIV